MLLYSALAPANAALVIISSLLPLLVYLALASDRLSMTALNIGASREIISASTMTDLSRYVLILGNFTSLRNVAQLSENYRYIFSPPKDNDNWKGAMLGEVHEPFLALEFEKDMYTPDGWMIGSSDDTDRCDIQIAMVGDKSGISRQHLRIDLDVESKCPRLTQFTARNPLAVTVHEKDGDRKLLLTQKKSVKIDTQAPITVNFGTSSFQAWRPILTSPEQIRIYRQRLEKHFKNYFDTMPIFPSTKPLSGTETLLVRFGQDGAVYKREAELGKGTHGTVFRVVEATSGETYAAKEPYFKASDSGATLVNRYKRLEAEYDKLIELKHVRLCHFVHSRWHSVYLRILQPHIVQAVELLLVADNRQLPPWMIMEYMEDTLENALERFKGPLGLVIVPQVINAVNFMHSRNYVHRDIKPGNILINWVNDQPVVKMADVGTMKAADENNKSFAGTPFYMAPECWVWPLQYSKEVDMWAIGLVMLQLFSDWDPTKDDAWANGLCGKFNKLGFTAWITEVLIPFVEVALPTFVQPILRGLLRESRQERWTADHCQVWVRECILHADGSIKRGEPKSTRVANKEIKAEESKRSRSSSSAPNTGRTEPASEPDRRPLLGVSTVSLGQRSHSQDIEG